MKRLSYWIGSMLALLSVLTLEGCRSCTQPSQNCDECVARCVNTQEVSPDICRATACASVCSAKK